MGRFRLTTALVGLAGLAATATTSAPTAAAQTIAELAVGNANLTLLVRALTDASLVSVVADPGGAFTVFAPTDDAFVGLAQTLGYDGTDKDGAYAAVVGALTTLGNGDPVPILTAVLQYHVAAGVVNSTALVAAGGYTPLAGPQVTLSEDGTSLVDAEPALADPMLIATDIEASNGIVHLIDGVLLPVPVMASPSPTPQATPAMAVPPREPAASAKTIAEVVADNDDFSLLLAALKAADLVAAVADRDASLTVFAPTNDAFILLSRTLGYYKRHPRAEDAFDYIVKVLTKLGDGDPIPLLTRILTYHALPKKMSTRDLAGKTVKTLEGGRLTIRPWLRVVDAAPAVRMNAKISPGDVSASNGVIHVINGVLLPFPVCPAYKEYYCHRTHRRYNAKACRCERRRE